VTRAGPQGGERVLCAVAEFNKAQYALTQAIGAPDAPAGQP
jgi:hypothetical protein